MAIDEGGSARLACDLQVQSVITSAMGMEMEMLIEKMQLLIDLCIDVFCCSVQIDAIAEKTNQSSVRS